MNPGVIARAVTPFGASSCAIAYDSRFSEISIRSKKNWPWYAMPPGRAHQRGGLLDRLRPPGVRVTGGVRWGRAAAAGAEEDGARLAQHARDPATRATCPSSGFIRRSINERTFINQAQK